MRTCTQRIELRVGTLCDQFVAIQYGGCLNFNCVVFDFLICLQKGKKGTSRKHSHAFEQLLRDEVDDDGEKDDQEMSDLHERMQGTEYEDEEEQKTQKEGEILEEEVTGVDPREEMLRIIEENMQQVNLLDEQL